MHFLIPLWMSKLTTSSCSPIRSIPSWGPEVAPHRHWQRGDPGGCGELLGGLTRAAMVDVSFENTQLPQSLIRSRAS